MTTLSFAGYEALVGFIRRGDTARYSAGLIFIGGLQPWGDVIPMELGPDGLVATFEAEGMEDGQSVWVRGMFSYDAKEDRFMEHPFERGARCMENGDKITCALPFIST